MLKVAICDDEYIFAEKIQSLLSEYLKQKKIQSNISIYHSGKELIELGSGMAQYQVIFLDINMDEVDGIETARKIREYSNSTMLVFVTAYIKYAPEGYKLDAVRFLLKDQTMFKEALWECMNAVLKKIRAEDLKVMFSFHEGKKEIPISKLMYIESNLHKLEFHVLSDDVKVYSLHDKLDRVEEKYKKYNFIRTHQSYLVNMRYILRVKRYELVLTNGMKLPIPRSRYKEVEEAFISYKGEL